MPHLVTLNTKQILELQWGFFLRTPLLQSSLSQEYDTRQVKDQHLGVSSQTVPKKNFVLTLIFWSQKFGWKTEEQFRFQYPSIRLRTLLQKYCLTGQECYMPSIRIHNDYVKVHLEKWIVNFLNPYVEGSVKKIQITDCS